MTDSNQDKSPIERKERIIQSRGLIFSILYNSPYKWDDSYYAADWGYVKGKWTTSDRDRRYFGSRWYLGNDFDEHAYKAVLEAFGLSKENFTLEQVVKMNPRELAKIGTKNPSSSTIGDYRYASEVEN